ncbi:unnamed protein product [Adineta ricciae]|uniref:Uncharacterized protein n=1 Tax=Adineta ricciae TaxID=249248 RepID=A0A815BCC7_ADIRI|nr:unnamed protein product [Adineta ricciae]
MPLNEFSCDESIEANEDRDSPNELEGQQESGRVNQYIDHGLPVQVVAPTGHFPRNSNVPPSNSAGSNPTNVVCHPVDCSRSCMVSTNHAQRSLALKRLCQSVQRSAHGKKTNRRYSKRDKKAIVHRDVTIPIPVPIPIPTNTTQYQYQYSNTVLVL